MMSQTNALFPQTQPEQAIPRAAVVAAAAAVAESPSCFIITIRSLVVGRSHLRRGSNRAHAAEAAVVAASTPSRLTVDLAR